MSDWNPRKLAGEPAFAPLADLLLALPVDRLPGCEDLNALAGPRLLNARGMPVRFGEPLAGSDAPGYERRVLEEGVVSTRPGNLHDLFNALVWLAFPSTKAALNALHVREMAAEAGVRGTARDVLTLFDEGGMLVASSDDTLDALLAGFQWKALFWERRGDVRARLRFFTFGHSIYEKAVSPYKGVTTKVVFVRVDPAFMQWGMQAQRDWLDAAATRHFGDPRSLASTRALPPLPVLGIPGWTPDNEDPAYYDDQAHFRSGRRKPGGVMHWES